MQLTFDSDVEAFRDEFAAFLDEHLPDPSVAAERSGSTADVPDWARQWQRLQFDHGWLLPGNPPEFGGRNATIGQYAPIAMETLTTDGPATLTRKLATNARRVLKRA